MVVAVAPLTRIEQNHIEDDVMPIAERVMALIEEFPELSEPDASRFKTLVAKQLNEVEREAYAKGADDTKAALGNDYEVFKVNIKSQVLEAAITTTSEVCERIALALESQSKPEGRDAAFECAKIIRDLPRA